MSFLFGGARAHVNPETAEGRRRAERRFARDIGTEATLADDSNRGRRRMKTWPIVLIAVVMLLGGMGLLPRLSQFELTPSCTNPALALRDYDAAPQSTVEWKATGPDSGDYVLVLDGGTVTDQSGTLTVADGGAALSPVFRMTNCVAHQGLATPTGSGTHNVRLMHRATTDADYKEVTAVALTVR